jgi:L-asparaginase
MRICHHGLNWAGASTLPKVLFLYTGGTISQGSDIGRLDTTTYGQLERTAEELLARIPEILDIAQIAISDWSGADVVTGSSDEYAMNMFAYAWHPPRP